MSDLSCLNCHVALTPEQGKLFKGVFCCEACGKVAESTITHLHRELMMLYRMAEESVRLSLLQGKLHLPSGPRADVSKEELLRSIMGIVEKRHAT